MGNLLTLFANNLLPIFLMAGAGYAAAKWLHVKPEALSKVVLYIFSPCLVFDLLSKTRLENGAILQMFGYAAVSILGIGLLTWFVGRMFIKDRKVLVAVILTTTLMNSGALGLPLSKFAFGDEALAHATLFFAIMVILTYTLGVMIASLGSASLGASCLELLKIPTLYGVLLAFIFMALGWQLPEPVNKAVSSLSDATIPGMLVLLGIQLQQMKGTLQVGPLVFANLMRLGGGLVLGIALSAVFGLGSTARQAGIIESAMPSAITTIVLATEYDLKPDFVTMVVFTTTLLSPLTLTPLLHYLSL